MIFERERWSRAIEGIEHTTLERICDETLAFTNALPKQPTVKDVGRECERLAEYRALLERGRNSSYLPGYLPPADISDFALAVWMLGLAHFLTIEGNRRGRH